MALWLQDLVALVEVIAPLRWAALGDSPDWQVGDPSNPRAGARLTLDVTPGVGAQARSVGDSLIVAQHPPLFRPIKRNDLSAPDGGHEQGGRTP
ncbi:MAG: Nif3-like dinuclear metal center hexameric protein [Chloroflexi bacterium]|nr:Nif3-like dinuclear metal center hexameric protein [Chloroflexota bacterium]